MFVYDVDVVVVLLDVYMSLWSVNGVYIWYKNRIQFPCKLPMLCQTLHMIKYSFGEKSGYPKSLNHLWNIHNTHYSNHKIHLFCTAIRFSDHFLKQISHLLNVATPSRFYIKGKLISDFLTKKRKFSLRVYTPEKHLLDCYIPRYNWKIYENSFNTKNHSTARLR